jgi:hypothetical protein
MYCEACMGRLIKVSERGGRAYFQCEDCGHRCSKPIPNHVVLGPGNNMVRCTACGRSYTWNMPCPIPMFVAGNEAFAWDHSACLEWLQDARNELISTLITRYFRLQGYE